MRRSKCANNLKVDKAALVPPPTLRKSYDERIEQQIRVSEAV